MGRRNRWRWSALVVLVLAVWVQLVASTPASFSFERYPTPESYMEDDNDAQDELLNVTTWVRGGGATAIGSFMANLVPVSNLAQEGFSYTFAQLGTWRGFCRVMNYSSVCRHPWSGLGQDLQRPTSLDLAITTRGMTPAEIAAFPDLVAYPFAAAPVALIHNVQNLTAPLVLSRNVVAKIFRKCDLGSGFDCPPDDIRFWNDARIKALNPDQEEALDAAGEIQLLVRRDSAGITAAVKRAMSLFEDEFRDQINNTGHDPDSNNWRGVNARKVHGLLSIGAETLRTPNAISYVSMDVAVALNIPLVHLVRTDVSPREEAVAPGEETLTRALLERGMDFGSVDNDPPERRTVEFSGAKNHKAWPVVMGAYLFVRLNVTRHQGSCETRKHLLKFLRFLFNPNNARVLSIAVDSSVASMPAQQLEFNLRDIESKLRCGPNAQTLVADLLESEIAYELDVSVIPGFESLALILSKEFTTSTGSPLSISVFPVADSGDALTKTFVSSDNRRARIALRLKEHQANESEVVVPFSRIPIVVRYTWCGEAISSGCTPSLINFNTEAIRGILDGSVKFWNDTRLKEANPHITFPDIPLKVVHERFWRNYVARLVFASDPESISLETFPDNHIEYPTLYRAAAFLQNVRGHLMFFPSFRDDSVVNDELTQAGTVNGISPYLMSLSDEENGTLNSKYPLFADTEIAVPRVYENCHELRTERNAGGFLGRVVDFKQSATAELVEFLRYILTFPRKQHGIDVAEAPARQARELLKDISTTGAVAQVLRSVNILPLFDFNGDRSQRAALFKSLVCDDGSPLATEGEQLNLLPQPLIVALGIGLTGFSYAILIAFAAWTQYNSERKVVRYASPAFLYQIIFGAAVCVSSLIPLSMQEYNFDREGRLGGHDPLELEALDAACASIPWLYTFGYAITFSALFLKTWRLVKIFVNPRMQRFHRLQDKHLLQFVFIALVWMLLLNVIWLVTDPLRWERLPIQLSPDRLTVISSVGLCTVKGSPWIAAAPLLITTLVIMIVGLVLCYLSRNLPSEFQESSWITLCLIMQFQALVFVLPILALSANVPVITYVSKVIVVLLNSIGTVLLIFLPKFWALYGWGAHSSTGAENSSKRNNQNPNDFRKGSFDGSYKEGDGPTLSWYNGTIQVRKPASQASSFQKSKASSTHILAPGDVHRLSTPPQSTSSKDADGTGTPSVSQPRQQGSSGQVAPDERAPSTGFYNDGESSFIYYSRSAVDGPADD